MLLRAVWFECDVSDTHSVVPRARCQSLWPCLLAGCSAREAYWPEVLKGKPKGARDMSSSGQVVKSHLLLSEN